MIIITIETYRVKEPKYGQMDTITTSLCGRCSGSRGDAYIPGILGTLASRIGAVFTTCKKSMPSVVSSSV